MSKVPRGLRTMLVGTGLLGAAAVMLILGVAARGAGAPMFVFFFFLVLLAVFAVLALTFGIVGARQFKRENYGVRIRTAPAGQKRRDLP